MSNVQRIANDLLNAVLSGRYSPGSAIPTETELAAQYSVNRLTVREATRILTAKNVLVVRRGRGTYVAGPDEWHVWDPTLFMARSLGDIDLGEAARSFVEARTVVEVGIAQLAASRRTQAHLDQLERALDEMRAAAILGDTESFVVADIGFHDVIFDAAANTFLNGIFSPLAHVLAGTRRQTSSHPEIREHAIERHREILEALRSGDPERCRAAMQAHMNQTASDITQYIAQSGPVIAAMASVDHDDEFTSPPNEASAQPGDHRSER